ncbi:MAG TPA: hypothetical protein VF141_22645 [Chryseolinea sp.]
MNKVRIVMLALQFFCSNSTAISPTPLTIKPLNHSLPPLTLDVLTVYNPVAGQCDATPLVTASNQRINESKLRSGAIRWMALSRDLLKRWGGKIHYGDTIHLNAGDPSIDGLWVVHDTMNRRFRKRGDLLFDATVRSTGKWSNVLITLRKKQDLNLR